MSLSMMSSTSESSEEERELNKSKENPYDEESSQTGEFESSEFIYDKMFSDFSASASDVSEDEESEEDTEDSDSFTSDEPLEGFTTKLLDRFKNNIETLKSTKNWFGTNCDLQKTVAEALSNLKSVYQGYLSPKDNLPKKFLHDFRVKLGNEFAKSRLSNKLCGVICKIYASMYTADEYYLDTNFENAFDLLCGLTDASELVARQVAFLEVFLDKLSDMLRKLCEQKKKTSLSDADTELEKKILECLHNLAVDHRNYQILRDKHFRDLIFIWIDLEKDEDGESSENKDEEKNIMFLKAVSILGCIMDEKDSIEENWDLKSIVEDFFEMLNDALAMGNKFEENGEGWTLTKLVKSIRGFVQNDCFRTALEETEILPLLVRVAKLKGYRNQFEAIMAIWHLAFIKKIQVKIIEDKETMDMLQSQSKSDNKTIPPFCQAIFWKMRDLLKQNSEYKHLVSQSKDKSKNGHIMISYQWDNKKTAFRIAGKLKSEGYKVWIDKKKMTGSIYSSMARGVENASVVLICTSEKYQTSINCKREAIYAADGNKPLIPLRMDNYTPNDWLGIITPGLLYFDFSGRYEFEEKFDELLKEISKKQQSQGKDYKRQQDKKQEKDKKIKLLQLNILKNAFETFDDDGDNKISTSELGDILRYIGLNPTEHEIAEVMEKADADGSGYIEYDEYIPLLKSYLKPDSEIKEELKDAFKLFTKRTGKLDLKSLGLALSCLGEKLSDEEINELFNKMDTNEDGTVDIDEFVSELCAT